MPAYEKFAVASDNHGDMQDNGAVDVFFEFLKFWKPKHRIHLGDAWDFRCLRSKASQKDKLDKNLQSDIDIGSAFVEELNPTIYLMGNHDWRAQKVADDALDPLEKRAVAAIWSDMNDLLKKAKVYPYNKRDGICEVGDTRLVHGYSAGVGAVRKHALVYGKSWMGHLHAIEAINVERYGGAECRCIGALCKKEMGYNESQLTTLRQDHGFLYGVIFPNGRTMAWQAQEIGGVWVFPSEMKEIRRAK